MSRSSDVREAIRFQSFIDHVASSLGRKGREVHLRDYCSGLLGSSQRKSMEPIAAQASIESDAGVQAMHQRIHHFVSNSSWDGDALIGTARDYVQPTFKRHGGVRALIIDDTGFPKKGVDSVGVARQYCGRLGKQDNCQVAVSLHMACDEFSMPIAWRLFLPQSWTKDRQRLVKAGVPASFHAPRTKPEIALDLLGHLHARGELPHAPVLADAGYGNCTSFRDGIRSMGLVYAVQVQSSTTVWLEGTEPQAPEERKPGQRGRPTSRTIRQGSRPVAVEQVTEILALKPTRVRFRKGAKGDLSGRFCALRVVTANDRGTKGLRPLEWLLIEWVGDDKEPSKFHLSNLTEDASLQDLAENVHRRFRIEQDYGHLKDDMGLDHFEGRNWNGFHHHLALCSTAYAYTIARRGAFSPSAIGKGPRLEKPALPEAYAPRGRSSPRKNP